jgi:hypothetical protein
MGPHPSPGWGIPELTCVMSAVHYCKISLNEKDIFDE